MLINVYTYSKCFTFILKALLNPEAKNPPNGPITLLNNDNDKECKTNGGNEIVPGNPN